MRKDFSGKKVAILGFAVEGIAAADYILARGGTVAVFERKEEAALDAELAATIRGFKERGITFHFGEAGEKAFAGFDLLLRSPGARLTTSLVTAAAEQGVPVTSGTSLFFEECPATVVGVTGTKGKGTTASLIYEMLLAAGRTAHLVGNIGEPALAAIDVIAPEDIVVYELSSFQLLEITKSPHIAIVLMITQDHLEFHGSVANYHEAKANIVRYQTPDDIVIANIDYNASRRIGESSAAKKFWISRRQQVAEGCFVEGDGIILMRNGIAERIAGAEDIALPGPHNLENACAAIMAAALLDVPTEAMRQALRAFRGLPHRLQLAREVGGVAYYDDSISTTPESAIAAIEAFPAPKVLILGGSSKGAEFAELAAAIAASDSIRGIIGIGEEWPRIREQLRKHSIEAPCIEHLATMQDVVAAAHELAKPGDVVLLSPACASFGMFASYKDRGDQFARVVHELPE